MHHHSSRAIEGTGSLDAVGSYLAPAYTIKLGYHALAGRHASSISRSLLEGALGGRYRKHQRDAHRHNIQVVAAMLDLEEIAVLPTLQSNVSD